MTNIKFGKGKSVGSINSDYMGLSVNLKEIKDKKLQCIFNAIDLEKDGTLDLKDIKNLEQQLLKAASNDKNTSELSKKEAKNLLKNLGLKKDVNVKDLFSFFNTVNTLTKDNEIIAEGDYVTVKHKETSIEDIEITKDQRIDKFSLDKMEFSGKDYYGEYKVEKKEDGSYAKIYSDKQVIYDKTDRMIGMKDKTGEYLYTYNSDNFMVSKKNENGTFEPIYKYDKSGNKTILKEEETLQVPKQTSEGQEPIQELESASNNKETSPQDLNSTTTQNQPDKPTANQTESKQEKTISDKPETEKTVKKKSQPATQPKTDKQKDSKKVSKSTPNTTTAKKNRDPVLEGKVKISYETRTYTYQNKSKSTYKYATLTYIDSSGKIRMDYYVDRGNGARKLGYCVDGKYYKTPQGGKPTRSKEHPITSHQNGVSSGCRNYTRRNSYKVKDKSEIKGLA